MCSSMNPVSKGLSPQTPCRGPCSAEIGAEFAQGGISEPDQVGDLRKELVPVAIQAGRTQNLAAWSGGEQLRVVPIAVVAYVERR